MITKLFKESVFLLLLLPMLSLVMYAQTEDKIVTINDPLDASKASLYSGTYVYQGTRSSGGAGPVKVCPFYKNGNYYLYADYYSGMSDFPNGFAWFITNNILTVNPPSWDYWGWDGTSGMDFPEECTWWGDFGGNTVTITVTNAASGVAPTVTTMEASLVTTTSGTMGGNVTADGGATTDRGFVYSSSDATPTLGEPGVTQITKGTGTGTYTEVVSGLSAGVTYYYQAYAHNTYGTTYGLVKSFTTPTTSAPNKLVSNAGGANGVYLWIGQYYGKPAWKHETSNYWLYYSRYGIAYPSYYYWYIDDELKDEHGTEDFNYEHLDAATCPSSGWRNPDNSAATVTIVDYPQIDFTSGTTYSPGNPTGATNNNPIGRFYLDADIAGASLTAVTISAAGSRTGTNTLKLWSSTDATFNSGSDVQLNSQSDGASVAFSGFSSSISALGTYYFITTDLAATATGSYTLTIGSRANLTISGGASSTVFSNAALTSSAISIIPIVEIKVEGNSLSIVDGDISPSLSDHTDFGSVDIAGGTVVRTFTIENIGAGTLSLTDAGNNYVSLTGADFSITTPPSGSITNGVPTTFQITFNPTSTGLKTGTISIANNDADENPYNFSIQGTGTNEAPTDISLSANSVNENSAGNTIVGTLSTTDADAGDTHTYTLVAGTGSTDNASFNINGSSLRITNSPDFETKSTYSIRVRTTDQGSLTYEEAFTVTINNINEAPTDISLSASAVNENVAGNTTVGTLSTTDADAGDTHTYTLVAGTGSTDNTSFNINGSSLRITNSPDFETKNSYSIRVRTTDQGSLTYEEVFTITINNINEAPTDIALSPSSINENVVANVPLGVLSSTDPDAGNTLTYTLVAGTGSTDNASFNIIGTILIITNKPDFETKNSYSIRVRTTDQGSLTYEEAFTVTINNINEDPTDIALSASAVNENVAANSTVGALTSTDPDAGNTFTYTLVAGTGDADNASFNISGSDLRITNSPDFETKNSYSIRVRTTDQGSLTYEEAFTVTIINLNEAPIVTTQAVTSIATTTATGNGTISSLGDPLPTAYGICWNTTGSPTTSDNKVDKGVASTTGAFTASMTSLNANTTYYVRAFSTNSAGTSYGSQVSYTTNDAIPLPSIAFSTASSTGAESVSSASLQVELSTASTSDVTVDYAVTGTATGSGTDYTLANGTLTISAGNTMKNITISGIVDDELVEGNETVIVTLSNPVNAALGANAEHTYTITDNDVEPLPSIAFSTTTSSGAESVVNANLQVEISAASASDVTVDYAVTGTATGSGTDYTLANGTLTISAGNTMNNITISGIVDDALVEGDETVIVTLSDPVNATLGANSEHTYTITDNDNATNVSDISKSNLSVYPNPFTDNVYIDNLNSNISHVIISDLSGQTVLNTEYKGMGNVSLGHLVPGVYLVIVVNKNGEKQVIKIEKK